MRCTEQKTKYEATAYVGSSAFSHKGGLHASAVQKDPKTYEHIDPRISRKSQEYNCFQSSQVARTYFIKTSRDME